MVVGTLQGLYHEVDFGEWADPTLVISYQAGIWGYSTWQDSVDLILKEVRGTERVVSRD